MDAMFTIPSSNEKSLHITGTVIKTGGNRFSFTREALFEQGANAKTGNAFVTERIPKYTIFCFFTARNKTQNDEFLTAQSDSYAVFPVLAF